MTNNRSSSSSSKDSAASRCWILLTVLALVAALTLNVVSLALPSWLHFNVDGAAAGRNASSGLDYYTRSRGSFLTCLTDPSAPVLTANSGQVRYATCVENDIGGNLNATAVNYIGWSASSVLVLRRAHIGFHLASGFSLCLALLVCFACLARRALRRLFVSAGLCLLAAGLQFAALMVFNQALLWELLPPQAGRMASKNIYNAMSRQLQLATQVSTGESYFIALAAFSTCLASAAASAVCAALAVPVSGANGGTADDLAFSPTGHTIKANGREQPYAGAVRMDNLSNMSAHSGRLTRTPVRAQHNSAFPSNEY